MKNRSIEELQNIMSSWQMIDGILCWKRKPKNGAEIGSVVGVTTSTKGHQVCSLTFNKKSASYSVGQIAWVLYYGEFPLLEVDHINNDPKDHRKENLRLATRAEQCRNRIAGKSNRLNKGVYKRDYADKWSAQIWANGKCKNLGTYDSEEEAVEVRMLAAEMLHGDFANNKSYAMAGAKL